MKKILVTGANSRFSTELKKHNSYLYAFKKVTPNLFEVSAGYLHTLIAPDTSLIKTRKAKIIGIISAIILKKLFFRTDVNK